MANKNHPGPFNCHAAALPDEPIFTLLGRDPAAPRTIKAWANERERLGKFETQEDLDRIAESLSCADEMAAWREANLDPTGDGIPSWRLPRPQGDDERPDNEGVRVSKQWLLDLAQSLRKNDPSYPLQVAELLELAAGDYQKPDLYEAAVEAIRNPRLDNMHNLKARTVGRVPELGMPYGKANQVPERILHPAPAQPVPFELPGEWQTEEDVTTAADLAAKPDVPPHRFAVMHKGRNYAYARGLEVNPIHLPVALDAMADDGWHLLAIFGQTDSQHVGFIFKRGDVPIEQIEYTLSPNRRHPPIDFGNGTRPQSDEMDAYQSGVPLDEIVSDMGRGLEP